jgi:hypothetical protein
MLGHLRRRCRKVLGERHTNQRRLGLRQRQQSHEGNIRVKRLFVLVNNIAANDEMLLALFASGAAEKGNGYEILQLRLLLVSIHRS